MTAEQLYKLANPLLLTPVARRIFRLLQAYYDYQVLNGKIKWFDVGEFLISDKDAEALEALVVAASRFGMIIVEVGSWKGASTSVLAKAARHYRGHVYCVDHWRGADGDCGSASSLAAKNQDVFARFRHNITTLGYWDMVHPLVMDSAVAAKVFASNSVDMIFVDGDHRYAGFNNDLKMWRPKLKAGGIICGHDCEGYYSSHSLEDRLKIDASLQSDFTKDVGVHPGILKALYETFADSHKRYEGSSIWWIRL